MPNGKKAPPQSAKITRTMNTLVIWDNLLSSWGIKHQLPLVKHMQGERLNWTHCKNFPMPKYFKILYF